MVHAFLRTVATTPPPHASISDKLAATVGNTGNMLFETALAKQLRPEVQEIRRLEDIPQDLDHLVLSMSNFISDATDLGPFVDILEARRVANITMVGCGAQAYDFGERPNLSEGTKRFISILRERSASIGVRGIYTASVLEDMGIHNLDIVGCPSIYWPGPKGWPPFKGDQSASGRFGIHCTPAGKYRDAVRSLIQYGMKHSATYICQTEIRYLEEGPQDTPDFLYYMGDSFLAQKAAEYFRHHGRIFFNLPEWIEHNRGLDFVLGARFHGNVVAMLAGRPSLLLVFDTRTREMADHFSLPYMDFADFDPDLPMQHYVDRSDFGMFHGTYPSRLIEYAGFLEKNNVPHNLFDDYWAVLPNDGERQPYSRNLRRKLVHDAVLSKVDPEKFRKESDTRLKPLRSADVRDAVEIGIAV
ncbi:polysaccharide pyruvyl transferase family protein [Ovoidimarina sediminis]|uniref:polysaccharide pyruvyl transferase family protein n=1 Tax=Ovoidimarina sediminis TaxID=3079856 RepID=UPI00290A12F1|nr:polysaccharide pyruvyl transferase family protein [Rhodophyticola sp. MJ-SS7]MDU8944046.1 polysaccharide pyruvyl transferase family protein [Rhodophyticola sp. MJ-SS7]